MVFLIFSAFAVAFSFVTTRLIGHILPSGDFRGLTVAVIALAFFYLYALVFFRIFLLLMPLKEGEIAINSKEEFGYHVYLLFYLIYFYPIMRSGFVPVPLMRLFYIALGARLGHNTYSAGIIYDPHLVSIGDNSLIGQYALLMPHAIDGKRLAHSCIKIGNNVTIGAHAVIMSGVTIGEDAIVAVGAVVPKGSRIGIGEIWGGIPARKIKDIDMSYK
ncbi:putative glycan acetyltransferase [Candidatus Sulfobium mesophilum]|uniref:Putative glycan acetyltransferase n=1 Tax=Candidatus Sulfobium mesophilum TaxID=2016548 RepID=A0A2U3QDT5_9BACT|nr:putative glycan acetyltransferase [Candidatus Sulfobium mesophilum]